MVQHGQGLMIHDSAIIDPAAQLGEGVRIGAFSIIGADVTIGDRTTIGPHVVIKGPTIIGVENDIHAFSAIGDDPQHSGYRGEETRLEIGDRNIFREFTTVHRGTPGGGGLTRIGCDNFFMNYTHVAHDCHIGSKIIAANGVQIAGHVEIGDFAILGGSTIVHQFCRIGGHCITGGGTVVLKDIPPFVKASGSMGTKPYGLNTKGLVRRGFTPAALDALKKAYRIVYRSGLLLKDALAELAALEAEFDEVRQFAEFFRSSERGVIR